MGSNSGEQEANLASRWKKKSVVRCRRRGNGMKRYGANSFTRSMAGCFRFLTLTQSDPQ